MLRSSDSDIRGLNMAWTRALCSLFIDRGFILYVQTDLYMAMTSTIDERKNKRSMGLKLECKVDGLAVTFAVTVSDLEQLLLRVRSRMWTCVRACLLGAFKESTRSLATTVLNPP